MAFKSRILALDPGGTTGVAKIHCRMKGIVVKELKEFRELVPLSIYITQAGLDGYVIVYERYVVRSVGMGNEPLEVIGMLKYLAELHKLNIEPQTPADRKLIDKRFHKKHFPSHRGDALRHAILYAVRYCYDKMPNLYFNDSDEPVTPKMGL